MTLPKNFEECPVCGNRETVSREGYKGESLPENGFTELEKVFSPTQDITKIIGPSIRGILVHYDVCLSCGTRYCTRAEISSLPVKFQQIPGGKPIYGS